MLQLDLSTFKSYIQDLLQNSESTFVNSLDTIIKITERDIYTRIGSSTLPIFKVDSSASPTALTANNDLFEIANAIDIESISVASTIDYLIPGSWRHLLKRTKEWIREAYPTSTTGRPKYYCLDDNDTASDNTDSIVIKVAPVPDIAYVIRYRYFEYPTSLVDIIAGQSTYISSNYTNVLIYGVAFHAYIFNKGDADKLSFYKGEYDAALTNAFNLLKEESDDRFVKGNK